jgi:hypothetical protein
MHKTLTKEPPDAPLNHGSRRHPMAALVPPHLAPRHTTTNQDYWTSFLSGEAWQVALGCCYGSQRMPWWGGCRQDDFASNLHSGPPAPLPTEFSRFCKMKYLLEKESHNKNEENTLKELNENFLTVYGLPK